MCKRSKLVSEPVWERTCLSGIASLVWVAPSGTTWRKKTLGSLAWNSKLYRLTFSTSMDCRFEHSVSNGSSRRWWSFVTLIDTSSTHTMGISSFLESPHLAWHCGLFDSWCPCVSTIFISAYSSHLATTVTLHKHPSCKSLRICLEHLMWDVLPKQSRVCYVYQYISIILIYIIIYICMYDDDSVPDRIICTVGGWGCSKYMQFDLGRFLAPFVSKLIFEVTPWVLPIQPPPCSLCHQEVLGVTIHGMPW